MDKRTGAVSAEEVAEKATAENTCLVTIMAANNETGVMQVGKEGRFKKMLSHLQVVTFPSNS